MSETLQVRFEPEQNRTALYDGNVCIGDASLWIEKARWVIVHVYVEPAYRGREYGEMLVHGVVEAAREAGAEVDATCPFAANVLARDQKMEAGRGS